MIDINDLISGVHDKKVFSTNLKIARTFWEDSGLMKLVQPQNLTVLTMSYANLVKCLKENKNIYNNIRLNVLIFTVVKRITMYDCLNISISAKVVCDFVYNITFSDVKRYTDGMYGEGSEFKKWDNAFFSLLADRGLLTNKLSEWNESIEDVIRLVDNKYSIDFFEQFELHVSYYIIDRSRIHKINVYPLSENNKLRLVEKWQLYGLLHGLEIDETVVVALSYEKLLDFICSDKERQERNNWIVQVYFILVRHLVMAIKAHNNNLVVVEPKKFFDILDEIHLSDIFNETYADVYDKQLNDVIHYFNAIDDLYEINNDIVLDIDPSMGNFVFTERDKFGIKEKLNCDIEHYFVNLLSVLLNRLYIEKYINS